MVKWSQRSQKQKRPKKEEEISYLELLIVLSGDKVLFRSLEDVNRGLGRKYYPFLLHNFVEYFFSQKLRSVWIRIWIHQGPRSGTPDSTILDSKTAFKRWKWLRFLFYLWKRMGWNIARQASSVCQLSTASSNTWERAFISLEWITEKAGRDRRGLGLSFSHRQLTSWGHKLLHFLHFPVPLIPLFFFYNLEILRMNIYSICKSDCI